MKAIALSRARRLCVGACREMRPTARNVPFSYGEKFFLQIIQKQEHLSDCENIDKTYFKDPVQEKFAALANGCRGSQKPRKDTDCKTEIPHKTANLASPGVWAAKGREKKQV